MADGSFQTRTPTELATASIGGSDGPVPPRPLEPDEDPLTLGEGDTPLVKLNKLDAYFVSDRMFACIHGGGLGLRLPVATVTELQFSRSDVAPFQPGGLSAGATREWVQINRPDAAGYEQDLELIRASLEFVKAGRR